MSTLPISSIAALSPQAVSASSSSGSTSSGSSSSSPAAATNLASENVFLQLLVAQLKYQDLSDPASGTEFVTQLATFSQLQEDTESATDLGAGSADVHIGNATVAAGGRCEQFGMLQPIGEQ